MLHAHFWHSYFKTYDVLNRAIPYKNHLELLTKLLSPLRSDIVLDLGSGTGNLSILLKPHAQSVIGIDLSKAGIQLHKEKDKSADTLFGDITKSLPFPDNHFDRIVSNNVLYTITKSDRQKIYPELKRVLKPGGILVLANVKQGFRPSAILRAHFRAKAKQGFFKAILEILQFSIPVLKMLWFNWKITRENQHGSYDFFKSGEQLNELETHGFQSLEATQISYASQCYVDTVKNTKP